MLHLKLFGKFELTGPAGRIAPSSTKLSAFMAYLALAAKPVPRERLTTLLWGSHFDDQARQNFRQALARLRKLIGTDALISDDQAVQISPAAVTSDARQFESLLRSASEADLRQAVSLLDDELLAGIDVKEPAWEDWLSGERHRFGKLACDALVALGRIDLAQGHATDGLVHAEDCVRRDMFREDAHRLAIQAYVALGRRAEALKHYQSFVERLKQDLNTTPEAATVQVYERARLDTGAGTEPQTVAPGRKPSIAVLPFANLSNDPEQDYFADGITEDITTELSRFRQFKIKARAAVAMFSGSEADALKAGRELGVRYLVSGSVRRLGQRLRISTQLVDADTGNQVWAERFDRSEEDLFAVQDQVVRTIASTLVGRVEAAGVEQAKRRHPGSLGAYDCVLRAEMLPLYDRKNQIEARFLYEKAIGLDPAYARPHAMLANLAVIDWMEDMSGSDTLLDRALELAKKSVALDENDATCQMTLGAVYSNLRKFQLAEHHYQRAMELNLNNPLVVATVGTLHLYRGDALKALKIFEEARILDPYFEPSWYWPTLGIARFVLGQYLEAVTLLERSPNRPHWVTAYLSASFALLGEAHKASHAVAETQRALPGFRLERFTTKEWQPESDTGKKLLEGLRKAGFPNAGLPE